MKTFLIERDVLTQVWVKQKITVPAEDLIQAIEKVRETPESKLYTEFLVEVNIPNMGGTFIESSINFSKCRQIPTQGKLTM